MEGSRRGASVRSAERGRVMNGREEYARMAGERRNVEEGKREKVRKSDKIGKELLEE